LTSNLTIRYAVFAVPCFVPHFLPATDTLRCDGTTTDVCHQVSRIKERVEEKEGIPPAQQRLIFGGKQM